MLTANEDGSPGHGESDDDPQGTMDGRGSQTRITRARPFAFALDRTAVLVVGLVGGFVIGASFGGGSPAPGPPPVIAPQTAAVRHAMVPAEPSRATTRDRIDPAVLARVKADNKIRVGVFGDSFGVGIYEGFYSQLPGSEGYVLYRFGKESTGFTRYHALNLEQDALRQLRQHPVDVAVVSFGANDIQPVYADGHLYAFMSPGWQRVIGSRIAGYIHALRSTGAKVWWIGLPVMRDPEMDANVRAIDAFFEAQMKVLGVPFVATRSLSLDTHGRYNNYLPDDRTGEPILMRTGDGIHMMGVGYERLTKGTSANIERYAARLRQLAGRSAPSAPSTGADR